jgi:hypothetical protein
MSDFSQRAEARRGRLTLTKGSHDDPRGEVELRGAEAVSLVHTLTMTAWVWSREPLPQLARQELPCRFIPRRRV